MINFQFRIISGEYYPQLQAKNLPEALNACLFVICDLQLTTSWYIALSGAEEAWREFPDIHLQAVDDGIFMQIFTSEHYSPDGEEGWQTLLGSKYSSVDDPFCLTEQLNQNHDLYFEARFSQGIAFSKELVADINEVVDQLKHLSSVDQDQWLKKGKWLNLGLI